MRGRRAAVAVVMTCLALAAAAAAASGAGAPPPPVATGGAAVSLVASGLGTPTSFAVGDGVVFEGDGGNEQTSGPPNGGVFVLRDGTATKLAGSPMFVAGLAWHDGALYVSGGSLTGPTTQIWQVQRWSGWNGTAFARRQAVYTAPAKLNGLNGIAFGPHGRLYVGVDVGLTDNNDHGPATTSPHVYQVLSMSATGEGKRVFARGIRQPWQFAFAPGSATPFVSALGQDKGAKDPPDFVLKLHHRDDYGFPGCTWLDPKACKGFTKPFVQFAPHTDIMGLAVIGDRLYMTSFAGRTGKGPGGEVLSMPLAGGKVKLVVGHFVAPVVGLGESAGRLYIGELTGQVFSVKP